MKGYFDHSHWNPDNHKTYLNMSVESVLTYFFVGFFFSYICFLTPINLNELVTIFRGNLFEKMRKRLERSCHWMKKGKYC